MKRELPQEEATALRVWQSKLDDGTLTPEEHVEAKAAIHAIRRTGPMGPIFVELDRLKALIDGDYQPDSSQIMTDLETRLREFEGVVTLQVAALKEEMDKTVLQFAEDARQGREETSTRVSALEDTMKLLMGDKTDPSNQQKS